MNKLFKKSSIMLIAASLVIAGGVSAALVSYISNATTAEVEVSSPVSMGIYEGGYTEGWTGDESINLTPTYGGSSMPFTTTAKNNANNRIGGYYVMVMEATDDGDLMTGDEFTSIDYTINESGYTGEDGELISLGKLCVVRGDGSLTKLADIPGWGNQKMILFYDYDGGSGKCYINGDGDEICEGDICSALTPYLSGESRSFTHLNAGATRVRTFTPTWATTVLGNFSISSQYVHDLAAFAAEQY